MLEKKNLLEKYNKFLKNTIPVTYYNFQKKDKVYSNKLIVFFNSDFFENKDLIKLPSDLIFSIHLCIYKDTVSLFSNKLHEDLFIPLSISSIKNIDIKEFESLVSKSKTNESIFDNLQFEYIKISMPNYLEEDKKNTYIQEKFRVLISLLVNFTDVSKNWLNIDCIDFISPFLDKNNKFQFWNEVAPLSKDIHYFESEDRYSLVLIKLNSLYIRFYDYYNIIPLYLNDIDQYLFSLLQNKDFISLKKGITHGLTLGEDDQEKTLNKFMLVYWINYILWISYFPAMQLWGSQSLNILKINTTKCISLSSLGRLIFDFKDLKKIEADIDSIRLGKASLMSGVIDLEHTNQNEWSEILSFFLEDKINSWEDLLKLANDLNVEYLYEYDIVGAFTYAASKPLLSGIGKFSEKVDLNCDKGLALAFVELNNNNYYVTTRPFLTNKVYLTNTNAYGWFLIDELKQFSELGCNVEIFKGYLYDNENLDLSDLINLLLFVKNEIKDVLFSKQIKLILNSFYGAFAFKKKKYSFDYTYLLKNSYSRSNEEIVYTSYPCYYKDGKVLTHFNILKKDTNEYTSSVITYSNITANNRINLRKKILDLKKNNKDLKFYQINIDSIYVNKDLNIDNSEIGNFKFVKKNRIIFFAPQFYLNIDGKYLLINNNKLTNIYEIKEKIKEYYFNKTNKFTNYYKDFNNTAYKYEIPNTDYLINLEKDLLNVLISTHKSVLDKANFTITTKEVNKILSFMYSTINKNKIGKNTIKKILQQNINETNTKEKKKYAIQFEAFFKENSSIINTINISIDENILESPQKQLKLELKLNAIFNKWDYKYNSEKYDKFIYLSSYDYYGNLIERENLCY